MTICRLACAFALVAGSAFAQTTLSAEIGTNGLAATELRLAALPAPADEDRFALGAVRFLAALERGAQVQYAAGMPATAMVPMLPLPLAESPPTTPPDPAAFARLLRDLSDSMAKAREPLQQIAEGSDFGLTIDFADLWFDLNADGKRGEVESVVDIAGPVVMGWEWAERDPATPAPVVRFDVADAAWLAAYTHLVGGLADTVLAYDPTEAIRTVMDSRAAFADLSPLPDEVMAFFPANDVDAISVLLRMLDQTPDTARAAQAHGNFLAMIAQNRVFWARVAAETDDNAEWVPNDRQASATGLVLPQGTGAAWLAVLGDVETILKGEVLLPFWRVGPDAGLNLARLFTDPRPIDVAGWIQGADALPYLEKGRVATGEQVMAFDDMVSGNSGLFAIFLN